MLAALAEVFWGALAICAVVGLVLFLAQFFPTPEPPDVERGGDARTTGPAPGTARAHPLVGCRSAQGNAGKRPHTERAKDGSPDRYPTHGLAWAHPYKRVVGRQVVHRYKAVCFCRESITELESIAACEGWITVHAAIEESIALHAPGGEW